MNDLFSDRIKGIPKSFVREILKVVGDPKIISFAGGLPNPDFFPIKELQDACCKVLEEDGRDALQYSTTEGYRPLREYIAKRYLDKKGLKIDPDEILITTGSQQGLDLLGKTFINEGDSVIIEEPGYLGAIQSFSMYGPKFKGVPLLEDGIDIDLFRDAVNAPGAKLFYTVSNFQNPAGLTYTKEKRKKVAEILKKGNIIAVEDDPYGELRFMGDDVPPIKHFYEDTVLLGSFSKIVTPAFRTGWVVAKKEFMDKIVVAKQAADLHTNYFTQRVLYRYLTDNNIDDHIKKIKNAYGIQREAMVNAIEKYFPKEVKYTKPDGGMFLWVTLPKDVSSLELFEIAIKDNVAFVPGTPFYANGEGDNSMRLNYSCASAEKIEEGIKRLSNAIKTLLASKRNTENTVFI